MRFAANLGFLFSGSLSERLSSASRAGFKAVELAFDQFDTPAKEIAKILTDTGLTCALINTPKGQQCPHGRDGRKKKRARKKESEGDH